MRTQEILRQIEVAVAEEKQSHRLRGVLVRAAHLFGRKPTQVELDVSMQFVVEYIRHVPVLLDAVHVAGRKAGVLKAIQPLLDFCEEYWFTVMDIIPDHFGLVGYLDDAYCVLSVLQAIDERARQANVPPLTNVDLAPANQAMRALIGEPAASKLDTTIAAAIASPRFSSIDETRFPTQLLAEMRNEGLVFLDRDPIWGDESLHDLVETRMGTMGVELGSGSASSPPAPDERPTDAIAKISLPAEDSDLLGVEEPPATASKRRSDAATRPPRTPTHAEPTAIPATSPPAGPRYGETQKKLARARPPRAAQPVSTGFSTITKPGDFVQEDQPIAAGARYYFWLEIGEVAGSIESSPTPVPVDLLPARARLVVVLFSPDGGFHAKGKEDLGELELRPDGMISVAAQPSKRYAGADASLLERRLLFPVSAPTKPGSYRLRCSIYCRGVLVQSRLIEVEVGGTKRVSRVDFTLATKLNPARLQTLAEHRFSVLSNHGPGDNHDFYVYGANGKKTFRDSITIPATTLSGALEIARAALRRASWGDEEAWEPNKKYRYGGTAKMETLREDLAVLAIAGWRIYDLLANQLAGGKKNVPKLEELVRVPGLVQISPDASLGMVLPAALIYDYKIKTQAGPPSGYVLCKEFERAYGVRSPLEETACFQGHCPSRGQPTTVCPSGFWGFRHGLGLPISDVEEGVERETEFDVRLEYSDIPVIVLGVSRARDLPRTQEHTRELQALRPAWGKRGWMVEDRLDPLLEAMRSKQPHVVYLYCHGSGRTVGAAEIPMLYLGENPQEAKPGEWLERSMLRGEIEWTKPRPLVFLNGCHTAVLDSRTTLDFVTGFVQNARACGVVGTEVTVFEPLAGAFATRFMARFLDGAVVGQAIRDARLDLLLDGNPLGLVYTPFVLSGTQLVRTGA